MTKIDGGLRQIFRDKLPKIHWQSVETHGTGKGTPDCNGCGKRGAEFWMEFKYTEYNKVKSLQPEQVAWCEKRLRHGGRVFFAVRHKPRDVGFEDNLWLIRGEGVRELYLGGLSSLSKANIDGVWPSGPRNWDWGAILAILNSN